MQCNGVVSLAHNISIRCKIFAVYIQFVKSTKIFAHQLLCILDFKYMYTYM